MYENFSRDRDLLAELIFLEYKKVNKKIKIYINPSYSTM